MRAPRGTAYISAWLARRGARPVGVASLRSRDADAPVEDLQLRDGVSTYVQYDWMPAGWGAAAARGRPLGSAQSAHMSVPPPPPLLLASTSPQRRAILEQLQIPFEIVPPVYEEHDPPDADAEQLVRDHARGKARSVAAGAGPRPVLGVDTTVVLDGRIYAKPGDAGAAERMLEELSGRTHAVLSGLCLVTPGWEVVETETTLVTFRPLTPRDLASYVSSREWEGRAGGYAIQGRGAGLVERVEGDYLNVVGLPAALLVRLLAGRFAGVYGYG